MTIAPELVGRSTVVVAEREIVLGFYVLSEEVSGPTLRAAPGTARCGS